MKTAKHYLQQPYARIVIPVEPKGFHAEVLEFPGCFAQGKTPQDAYSNLEKAAASWIDTCLTQGQEIPEPSSNLTFSGRIAFRLPKSVHRHAALLAERDKTSLNTYLVSAVSAKVGAQDFYNVLAQRLEQRLIKTISGLTQDAYNFWVLQTSATNSPQHRAIAPTKTESTAGRNYSLKLASNVGR